MHHRGLRLSICATLLSFVAACDSGAGESSSPPALAQTFLQAAQALAAKTGAPGEKGEMPPASDPAVQAFEEQSSRALTALGTPDLPIDGFRSFEQLCGNTANIVAAYAAAGTGGATGAEQQQLVVANLERNLDHLFTPLLFSAHCTAQHMPFLEGQIDPSDPTKTQALNQVRDGVSQQLMGLLQMAADPSLDSARRQRIMELVAADGGNFAVGLNPGQRQQIVAAAEEVEGTLPEQLQTHAERLRVQIGQASCGKICSAP